MELISKKNEEKSLLDFLKDLDLIAKHKKLRKVSFVLGQVEFGLSEMYNIEVGIQKIKQNGIVTAGFCESGNLKSLYLLSLMDERYSDENSEFMVLLPSVESFFFGNMLKNLGIQVESFASGTYKSLAEPFQRTHFSEEAKANITELVTSIQTQLVQTIQKNSSVKKEFLEKPILTAEKLLASRFLTSVLSEEDFTENYCNKNYRQTNLEDLQTNRLYKEASLNSAYFFENKSNFSFFHFKKPIIKIISLKGEILKGSKDEPEIKSGQILAYPLIKVLREIKEDKRVKGLILDIDSGGGSAYASELIYREVKKLGQKIKVYTYFQNAVASGGYYIACSSKKMVSNPYCITGSIGTIMIRPDLKNFYQKLGITKDRIGFYKYRDIYSEYGKLSQTSKKFLREEIKRVNDLFYQRVMESRNIKIQKLKSIAEGRVFSGLTFEKHGMIDKISSLFGTIQDLKQELKLDKVKIDFEQPTYSLKTLIKEIKLNAFNLIKLLSRRTDRMDNIQYKMRYGDDLYNSIHCQNEFPPNIFF